MSASLRRPVRLSSVELRMLPRPAFVLTDLIVEEDPTFGSEPILHANTVTASIWLLPLWQGRLLISRLSVDEASFNLVQMPGGHWNLDSLFHNAAPDPTKSAGNAMPLPYIEATNSRINIKNGIEKLPFSLLGADMSLWHEGSGEWRVRLRGQPSRTDVSLDLPDTGLVRMEISLGRAPELTLRPIQLDVDWRDAQLGQLSRLLLGTDQGWRGDLTGEIHVEGTTDSARVKTRLRASGVHRAEFTPASPIDFDVTCGLLFGYARRSVQDLVCNSPIGSGQARLTGEVPGDHPPRLTLELDRIPAQAGFDVLRTLRNNLGPGLEAQGTVSGRMSYDPEAAGGDISTTLPGVPTKSTVRRATRSVPYPAVRGPLSGSFTVAGLQLAGDEFSKLIQIPKMTIEAVAAQQGRPAGLSTSVAVPAGGATPLMVTAHLNLSGYELEMRGQAALLRLREFARIAGTGEVAALDQLAGEPATLDLNAEGPWLAAEPLFPPVAAPRSLAVSPVAVNAGADKLSGTLTLHNANWKSEFLANAVMISAATLRVQDGTFRWDPVVFSYGPVKGTATLEPSPLCEADVACPPRFALRFGSLDAAALQEAVLGSHEQGTRLSTLIKRLRPSSAPSWPTLEGTVRADSLLLAPITLTGASASIRIGPTGAEISSFDAGLLGGQVHGTGTVNTKEKPAYTLEGKFTNVDPAHLGRLLGMGWSGGALDGAGEVELLGYTDKDLTDSANGTLHFEWRHGSVASGDDPEPPPALSRFDLWTADAAIADGAITLKQNQVKRGAKKSTVRASVALGDPARITFGPPKEPESANR
jgi:AsmA-like C-terminal region